MFYSYHVSATKYILLNDEINDCSQIIKIFFMLFTNDLSIKSVGATFNKLSEYFKLKGIKILVDSKTYLTKIYF